MNKYNKFLEKITSILLLLLIANVALDVLLRYVFNNSSIALQEMEWHLFSAMFLLGIAYTLQNDAHVRVDMLYAKMQPRTQAMINIAGYVLFIVPICTLIAYFGIDFTFQAFLNNEQSGDPGGLTHRFIIKSTIPISFILVIISGFFFARNNYQIIKKQQKENS